ncbi:oxidoreductase [Paenibacillus sacheonensis]|uniref:Probable oxidoreductase n=1 Tax=Paenibacillus sacheonensis TaxID=742054 RepID=A0A7X5BX95_9BACL|nr:oxidoreductase [Paenibacillus sacheonensis]MBM7564979.1 NAD(P)-dependent dehydrogenase (short-subunit alcohol dehydrogenase family) [Paenibacillus sacheonensis]NBC70233.1 SDR family NAD(P)-dependent oxidoreductase [Paenibacillus sacheonensis]
MPATYTYTKTIQEPIPSGFGSETTAAEALGSRDLSGKIAIVTGGYSGLGLETARTLAEAGATVIVPARTPDKARAAVAGIPRVELETMDLMDPASIDAFAERFLATGRPLDILVNSAGIMAVPLTRDARGYESHFAVNHLGHFQLTARLWPALKQAGDARVVAVSSRALRLSGVDLADLNYENREYDKWLAYGQSKTANVLFAVELDRIGSAHGVRAFAVHPGTIITELSRHLSDDEMRAAGALDEQGRRTAHDKSRGFKTVEQGAATSVWCAANEQLGGRGGVYCEDVDIAAMAAPGSDPFGGGVVQWAVDPDIARRLWTVSENMTGVTFE